MTQTTITVQQQAVIVGLLAKGRSPQNVAARLRMAVAVVEHVARTFGYPDLGELARQHARLLAAAGAATADAMPTIVPRSSASALRISGSRNEAPSSDSSRSASPASRNVGGSASP